MQEGRVNMAVLRANGLWQKEELMAYSVWQES